MGAIFRRRKCYTGKVNLNNQINRPDLWVVGTEYDFGNGPYGKRYTGTVTAEANVQTSVLLTTETNIKILSYGGNFNVGVNGGDFPIPYTSDSGDWSASVFKNNASCSFISKVSNQRANAPFDIWLLYTKV